VSAQLYTEKSPQESPENVLSAPIELTEEINFLLRESVRVQSDNDKRLRTSIEKLNRVLLAQSESNHQAAFISELFSHCSSRLDAEIQFLKELHPQQIRAREDPVTFQQIKLSHRQIKILELLIAAKRRQLVARMAEGCRQRADLTIDSGLTVYCVRLILQLMLMTSGVLRHLEKTFPRRMRVTGVAVELSAPGSSWWKSHSDEVGTSETDYIHFDEALEAPKAILYMSSVQPHNGPTEFFPGLIEHMKISPLQQLIGRVVGNIGNSPSSIFRDTSEVPGQITSSPLIRRLFWTLPQSLRFNSHFGWDIPSGHSIVQEVNCRRVVLIGESGTLSLFDGSRIAHRGGLIQSGERIVLQIVFGSIGGIKSRKKRKWFNFARGLHRS
jgi:hypothetical protein